VTQVIWDTKGAAKRNPGLMDSFETAWTVSVGRERIEAFATKRSQHGERITPVKTISVYVAGLLCLVVAGCGDPEGLKRFNSPLPIWQEPELLYLQGQPCDRLVVEIDTVEGTEVDDGFVPALKEFLSTHCEKPGGITYIHDSPIPLSEAKRSHPRLIALNQMAGPPTDARAERTAYLYILIYDSEQMGLSKTDRSHVSFRYPCAVYVNVAWNRLFHKRMAARMAQHEAGHILGLCKNPSHTSGAHCTNDGCLMGAITISVSGWLFGAPPRQQSLCGDCTADLALSKSPRIQLHKMSFRGPVLLRQEEGYFVAVLPFHVLGSV